MDDVLWIFLLLILASVTFRQAWQARNAARQANKRVGNLEGELARLHQQIADLRTMVTQTARAERDAAPESTEAPVAAPQPTPAPVADTACATPVSTAQDDKEADEKDDALYALEARLDEEEERVLAAQSPPWNAPVEAAALPPREPPSPPPRWLLAAKDWLFGGNLVAKLGLLILFIGVAFLLKYTAARVTVPIELRLAGVVLADVGALLWAWRIRQRRPAISLPLQGTTLAVLMLTTFGAFRLYHLIPGGFAFALLFVLTAFTCVLAMLQNSQWLAIFGIVGGFAAPILASSGGGSHIGLFSYYALLNAGVFGLALRRSWRGLNLLSFAFTFAIGTAWGVLRYTPENYLSTQLFLILFFAFYVGISLSYARRQAVRLKNYVDGTLIFGTPMLGFGLQFSLVHQMHFGLAFSALALALTYIGLATALSGRRERYGLLVDAFLALGVVFGTLAIPFALDGRWTSAAWALEGAGIVWIGLRQRQTLTWCFGLLVQGGAWLSFLASVSGLDPVAALASNLWLGFILLAATAFLMATRFRAQVRQDDDANGAFAVLAGLFLGCAAVWLVAGAWTEIWLRTDMALQANLLVLSALLAALLLGFIAKRMAWPLARSLALTAQMVAGATLLALALARWNWAAVTPDLFDRPVLGALMILAGALFSSWALMRHSDSATSTLSTALLAWSGLWWFGLIAPALSGWLTAHYEIFTGRELGPDGDLWWSAYGVILAASAAAALVPARRLQWRTLRLASVAAWVGLAGATAAVLDVLYYGNQLPPAEAWVTYAILWLTGEWLLHRWPANDWRLTEPALRLLHTLRTAGPWLMIWPVAATWIARWLSDGSNAEAQLLADAGWQASASWARFIPAWLMMAALAWLMRQTRAGAWPVRPIAAWYQRCLIPLACAWSVLLVGVWNLTQDGAMAPLPYLPLANPLDLSSCFAALLALGCYRMLHKDADSPVLTPHIRARLPLLAAMVGYAWFNLMLLRAVSNYRGIPYAFDELFASQFVQTLLSLVWSVTALVLMRYAASRAQRPVWIGGAVLLGMVVGKLFLIDLSNVGGVERIISFVGVGALMVGIGYLAPYPTAATPATAQA